MHQRLRHLVPLVLFALPAGGALGAAELFPINDLRFGVTLAQQVRMNERITAPSGAAASYTWDDPKSWQLRYEVTYVQGMSRRGRPLPGFVWGLGAIYTNADITPGGYSTSSGVGSSNSRHDINLAYREYGLTALAGYATMPASTSLGLIDWEILPLVRGGLATAQTVTPGFTAERKSGRAPFWEAGLRTGLALADEGWLLDLHVDYTYGVARFDIGMGDSGDSKLTVIRRGFGAGADLGIRF